MSLFRPKDGRKARADFGTPVPVRCHLCHREGAERRPILILGEYGVKREPWELHTCRHCGYIAKVSIAPRTENAK
jgi:hypothetical protein